MMVKKVVQPMKELLDIFHGLLWEKTSLMRDMTIPLVNL